MPQTPEGPGGLSSLDDFDLLSLGLLPQEEEPQEEPPEEEPRINPLHDMDSLEFLLWAEEGARAQIARKRPSSRRRSPPRNNPNPKTGRHGTLRSTAACLPVPPSVTGFSRTAPGWR